MATKLFVGGLEYGVTDKELEEFFASQGTVASAVVIKDKFSGQSKGFGFVEMEDDAAAKKAIAELNGKELNGRSITVNEARPREDRPPRRDNDRNSGGGYSRQY